MSIEQPTLLFVEDDREIRELLTDLLAVEYRVVAAANGKEALDQLEALDSGTLDMILLDMVLPEMDGFELHAALRERFSLETVPVVFLSAFSEREQIIKGLQHGAADYIAKPFDTEILLLKIRNHIRQKHHLDRLYQMSMIDTVTALYNRRQFDAMLENEWNRCMRSGSELALLMIDVDFFKNYNDIYGHSEGDHCLYTVATEIQNSFKRSSDFVARYGGEEFSVILPDTDLATAVELGKRVVRNIEQMAIPHTGSRISEVLTVSVGASAVVPSAGQSVKELAIDADRQLYEAKASGRNCTMPGGLLSKIIWGEHFSVGHELMDAHHKQLIGYTNELIDCINRQDGASREHALEVMDDLNALARTHFESEEGLLQSHNYPEMNEHFRVHEQYNSMLSMYSSPDPTEESVRALVGVMRSWWEDHILVEDMAYKSFLKACAG